MCIESPPRSLSATDIVALSHLSSSCGSEPTGGRGRAGARDNLLELKRQTGLFLRFSYLDHAMIRLLM